LATIAARRRSVIEMTLTPNNDDVPFDRLVDGELPADERRALLQSLDSRPDGWRRCALAFLEAQSWRSELRMVATAPAAIPVSNESVAPKSASYRRTAWAAAECFAVAAALMLAFKLGGWQRNSGIPVANVTTSPSNQVASAPPSGATPAPTTAKPGDALNLWVRDDGGKLQRVRVPLVDAKALDRQYGTIFQTGVPDDVRNRLKDEGLTVQSKHQYAPMWLDNGRPMMVPVEDTKIVPVSNKVY
jgi:hypothetical protein